ncbi:MAG: hypothetical protein QOF79_446 [Actinomycetota bacterium]|jgi:hypothetical protein|nr:hypothetical protein [Actinomycetota bacterium]
MGIRYVVRVRPKLSLSVTGVVVIAVIMIPISLVLVWYDPLNGAWKWIVAVDLVLTAFSVAALVRQLNVFVAITGDSLIGNGIFSPLVSVKLADIRRVVLARMYSRHSSDSSVQFVALDAEGRCLFRMRGGYWHSKDLDSLACAVGVEVRSHDDPLIAQEFFETYPRSRYWFERAS